MDQEILIKLKSLGEKEFIDYCEKLPMKKYFRLSYSHEIVMKMLDFISVIDKNKEQLKQSGNKAVVESTTVFRPSQCLFEYIVSEISAFYTNAYQYIKQGENLPQIPDYWMTLKDFRNAMPGHRDNQNNFKVIADWMLAHKKVDSIGTEKIIKDFEDYFQECVKILGHTNI